MFFISIIQSAVTDSDMDILHDMAGIGDTRPSSEQNTHHHNVQEESKKTITLKHDES